jgi:hypothetical protein
VGEEAPRRIFVSESSYLLEGRVNEEQLKGAIEEASYTVTA